MLPFKRVLPLFFFIMIFFSAFSQKSFKSEFIIKSAGDTLQGSVEVKGSMHSVRRVDFTDASGHLTSYTSLDISGFYDDSWGLFLSDNVTFSTITGIDKNIVTVSPVQKVFLESVIQSTTASLYYFKGPEVGAHFYIKNGDAPPEELTQVTTQYVETSGVRKTRITKLYQQTLQRDLNNCVSIVPTILKTTLSKESLMQLFESYYKCAGISQVYAAGKSEGELTFGVTAGMVTGTVSLDSKKSLTGNGDIGASPAFTGGVTMDYLFSKRSQRVSLLNELMFRSMNATGSGVNPLYGTNIKYDFQLSYVRLNTMARYYLSLQKIKPFLVAGISNSLAVKTEGARTVANSSPEKYDFRNYEQGLLFGAGVNYQQVDFLIRWETTNGFSPNSDYIGTKNFYFTLTYHFKKKGQ